LPGEERNGDHHGGGGGGQPQGLHWPAETR